MSNLNRRDGLSGKRPPDWAVALVILGGLLALLLLGWVGWRLLRGAPATEDVAEETPGADQLEATAAVADAATAILLPTPSLASAPTASPSPTPCAFPVLAALRDAWGEDVGCPISPGLDSIQTGYAPFERGQMLWREDTNSIYVIYHSGTWEQYDDLWQAGDPEYSCGEANSPPTPVRGFGRVWCDHPSVRDQLGAVTAYEIGDSAGSAQDYVNGSIVIAPDGRAFVLIGETATWRQTEP